ncbi:hypothetical protein AC1031_017712 [Aphanomyces cochlioides]|nr:hypothetical protein AC1031_017712 [Aphanomyces cochlioides]
MRRNRRHLRLGIQATIYFIMGAIALLKHMWLFLQQQDIVALSSATGYPPPMFPRFPFDDFSRHGRPNRAFQDVAEERSSPSRQQGGAGVSHSWKSIYHPRSPRSRLRKRSSASRHMTLDVARRLTEVSPRLDHSVFNYMRPLVHVASLKFQLDRVARVCTTAGHPECTQRQKDYNDGVQLAGGFTDTIYNIVGWVYLAAMPFLVRKIGAKWVIVIACVPQVLLIVMAFCKVVVVDQVIVVLVSLSQQTVFALQMPMIVFVIGLVEDNNIGMYAGAFNSGNCAGQFLNFAQRLQKCL